MAGTPTELGLWLMLLGSAGAFIFPDMVLVEGIFADSFISRGTIRLIAAPLLIVSIVLLTDFYFHWSKGLI